MARYKVLSVEVDGVENEVQTELPLDADRVFFDNSGTGLVATDVRSAIIEAQTGSTTPDNFSYRYVSNKTVTIAADQQMIVHEQLRLLAGGDVVCSGEIIILTER
jgi:alkyl sulfatase BDS1-like metallo-beta-lactamase superfamily hydrolase